MSKKKKVLFINFGGLGDEILFLPTLLSFKAQYPDTEITLALEGRSKGFLSLTAVVDKSICLNIKNYPHTDNFVQKSINTLKKYNEFLKLLFKIWGENYNLVVSSGSNKFIAPFLFCTLIPKRIGFNSGKLSQKLLTKAVELNKNQYAVNMYHDLVTPLTSIRTELPILSVESKPVIPNSVLIHPGVSKVSIEKGIVKTISAEVWAEVIDKLANAGKRVFLIGGPDDIDCIQKIRKLVDREKYTNLFGKTSNLKELAELISSAEKFVCSDSAPLHIAVAMGVKTYPIFGPTDDNKLVPKCESVVPIKVKSPCGMQPCLWEKRQTSCENLLCLKISADKIVEDILNK